MGKKKSNFQHHWGSLTDIGLVFGLSAVKAGSLLKEWGLRAADGTPTPETLAAGLAKSTPTRQGYDHYMWNKEQVGKLFRSHGLARKCDPTDPAHTVALEVHKLIKDASKHEHRGEDKIAVFAYDMAVEVFQEALNKAKEGKRLGLASRIHQQLGALSEMKDFKFLHHGYSIPFEAVEAHQARQSLEQALPPLSVNAPRNPAPRI